MAFRPMPTAAEMGDLYKKGAQTKGKANFIKGVQRVTSSPTQAAIAAIPAMISGWNEAASSGRIAAGLQKITLQIWQSATAGKGADNYVNGVNQGASNYIAAMQSKSGEINSAMQQVQSMPKSTYAEREARRQAMSDALRQIWGTAGRS